MPAKKKQKARASHTEFIEDTELNLNAQDTSPAPYPTAPYPNAYAPYPPSAYAWDAFNPRNYGNVHPSGSVASGAGHNAPHGQQGQQGPQGPQGQHGQHALSSGVTPGAHFNPETHLPGVPHHGGGYPHGGYHHGGYYPGYHAYGTAYPVPYYAGGENNPPTSPPPAYTPEKPALFAIDPQGISRCMFNFTYIWLSNGDQFWYFPVFVGARSIAGFRWNGFRWTYFGIDFQFVNSFTC